MTKGIEKMLNLPHLADVMEDRDVDYEGNSEHENEDEADFEPGLLAGLPVSEIEHYDLVAALEEKLRDGEGADHEKAMDAIYTEMLTHARDIMDLSFNTDERSRRGLMEIATAMYKNVMDAKNSKRDAQLKLWDLIQKQKRLDFEEKKWRASMLEAKGKPGAISEPGAVQATVQVIEEDRNELIKRMIAQRKAASGETEAQEEE